MIRGGGLDVRSKWVQYGAWGNGGYKEGLEAKRRRHPPYI